MNILAKKLEAILFTQGTSLSRKKVCSLLQCKNEELEKALQELQEARKDTGIVVVDDGEYIALATHPLIADAISTLQKEDLQKPLSKASQETLSIIAYAGPISKMDLDFLRGVNTQYTLRRLSMRGLIHETKEGNQKKVIVSTDFLTHLGITKTTDMQSYEEIRNTILDGLETIKRRMNEVK